MCIRDSLKAADRIVAVYQHGKGGRLHSADIQRFVIEDREKAVSYTHLDVYKRQIQSFAVGETTPEEAHKIGMELAGAVLGGKYEFCLLYTSRCV